MKGLYYLIKKPYQFAQSKPVFDRLGGKIITIEEFPTTVLYFLLRYGPFRVKIMGRSFRRADKKLKGLVFCHSGNKYLPDGQNYKRVFVYHGTCDTIYEADGPDNKLLADWFEYYFTTGDKDLDKLKRYTHDPEKLDGKIIKIGMFRSDPILNKNYNKEKLLKKYGIKTSGKKIILYAPTWAWGGGTLGKCFKIFANTIPNKYIFIIRPHSNDKRNIRCIEKWQKKNRVKDFYFFPKPSQDIMHFIYMADLLIGDNSAVNYDFVLTKKPVVLVKSDEHEHLFVPPDEYNIKLCCPIFNPEKDNILGKIEDAFNNPLYRKRIENLVENSFYYNDGHAVDRMCSFVVDHLSEMGIIARDKTLKKLRKTSKYTKSYKFSWNKPV